MQIIFRELILPKNTKKTPQHADLSLVLSWNGPPVSPHRVPGRLLMLFTTSTHISVHTGAHAHTHTHIWLLNAKCLPNEYKHKCTNTRLMTCSHLLVHSTETHVYTFPDYKQAKDACVRRCACPYPPHC